MVAVDGKRKVLLISVGRHVEFLSPKAQSRVSRNRGSVYLHVYVCNTIDLSSKGRDDSLKVTSFTSRRSSPLSYQGCQPYTGQCRS